LDTQNFTILLKNSIAFPEFGDGHEYERRNINKDLSTSYLKSCIYNNKTKKDSECPIFRLGDIVKAAGLNYSKIAHDGAVLAIKIKWSCDFFLKRTIHDCKPKYSFKRKDNTYADVSKGFNYRCEHCKL